MYGFKSLWYPKSDNIKYIWNRCSFKNMKDASEKQGDNKGSRL